MRARAPRAKVYVWLSASSVPSRSAFPVVRRTVVLPDEVPGPPAEAVVVVVVLLLGMLDPSGPVRRETSKRYSQKGRRVMVRVVEVVEGCCCGRK